MKIVVIPRGATCRLRRRCAADFPPRIDTEPARALAERPMNMERRLREIRQIEGLGEISRGFDAILCDIWGVVHNGVSAFPPASQALAAFRKRGGAVVLITNAPRPSTRIESQLLRLGVLPEAFDAVVTSGDVAVGIIAERIGEPILHIGPARDLSLFEPIAGAASERPKLVGLDEASYAVCTGLRHDESETPEDYEEGLSAMAARAMTMLCANPDIVIHRGDELIYCAGALARRYEELGGSVIYAGKPFAPIYELALKLAEQARGGEVDKDRVLAIGDGMKTDIAGAARFGLDTLFVTHGIHRSALHGETLDEPADPAELKRLYDEHSLWPTVAITALRP